LKTNLDHWEAYGTVMYICINSYFESLLLLAVRDCEVQVDVSWFDRSETKNDMNPSIPLRSFLS
jgi:hypothetical protein